MTRIVEPAVVPSSVRGLLREANFGGVDEKTRSRPRALSQVLLLLKALPIVRVARLKLCTARRNLACMVVVSAPVEFAQNSKDVL
mmetsp:Transcript_23848/g.38405  ORF Transcript_23848/g.38405 Transcript_23848/m.38405 type:complete len:85 (-) Transcript_23848:433-687(-)